MNFETKKVILICGLPRSGTTFLNKIFKDKGYPSIGESWFLPFLGNLINKNEQINLVDKYFHRSINELDIDKSILLQKLSLEFFNSFNSNVPIVDKTPQNLHYIKSFLHNDEFLSIIIERNLSEVILSMLNTWSNGNFLKWDLQSKSFDESVAALSELKKISKQDNKNVVYINYDEILNLAESIPENSQKFNLKESNFGDPYQKGSIRNQKKYDSINHFKFFFMRHKLSKFKSRFENLEDLCEIKLKVRLSLLQDFVDISTYAISKVIDLFKIRYLYRLFS